MPAPRRSNRRCRRFFLVGTDYVYPRTTNATIRNYLAPRGIGAVAVDEFYTPFGEKVWNEAVHNIRKFAGRDGAIIAPLSGDSNVHFFRERAPRVSMPIFSP
jgi:urea transport system substrate-binding protein